MYWSITTEETNYFSLTDESTQDKFIIKVFTKNDGGQIQTRTFHTLQKTY